MNKKKNGTQTEQKKTNENFIIFILRLTGGRFFFFPFNKI